MHKNIIDDLSIKMMKTGDETDLSDVGLISLLKQVNDINMVGSDGRTLLIHAALYNRLQVAEYLLNKGADISCRDKMGISALHAAVISSDIDIINLLLSSGIDPNVRDIYGNTALAKASQNREDIIALLLENGTDCTLKNNFGISAYAIFQAYPNVILLMEQYIETHME